MSKLDILASHSLKHDEALNRIKNFCAKAPSIFKEEATEFQFKWTGTCNNFSFKVGTIKINGILAVNSNNVHINCKIPFAFLLFKAQIDKTVRQYIAEILKNNFQNNQN